MELKIKTFNLFFLQDIFRLKAAAHLDIMFTSSLLLHYYITTTTAAADDDDNNNVTIWTLMATLTSPPLLNPSRPRCSLFVSVSASDGRLSSVVTWCVSWASFSSSSSSSSSSECLCLFLSVWTRLAAALRSSLQHPLRVLLLLFSPLLPTAGLLSTHRR